MQEEKFDYPDYFNRIKPRSGIPTYNRFLFAFLSVHTNWKNNVRAYELMKGAPGRSREETARLLRLSGVGMHNQRTEYIHRFSREYVSNPSFYQKGPKEEWIEYRDRLTAGIKGLGLAKTSFAIEMIYPNEAGVSCIDVHIARLCGVKKLNKTSYYQAEQKMLSMAKTAGITPTHHRWSYWDRNQGYENCRYWSYCLETETTNHKALSAQDEA